MAVHQFGQRTQRRNYRARSRRRKANFLNQMVVVMVQSKRYPCHSLRGKPVSGLADFFRCDELSRRGDSVVGR